MKRFSRKLLAGLLTLALLVSCGSLSFGAFAADDVLTDCKGQCEYCPSIVIPGVFQSQTRLYDDDGNVVTDDNGKPLDTLFVKVTKADIFNIVRKAIVPLTLSLTLQRDVRLSDTVADIVVDVIGANAKDNEGNHIRNIDVIRYKHSVAKCTPEGRQFIYSAIPLERYAQIAGEDHLYFFTYDSFDSVSALADELYEFIQQVKRETGHDKINLVPISQGGSIANELMERYRDELVRDLDRLVFIVPALDGSDVLGKIFGTGFVKEDETLYRDLFPTLMKDEDQKAVGYGVNLAIRLLSKQTVYNVLDKTVEALAGSILANSTCMWALTPSSQYDALYQRYLADGSREKLREELEFFHAAQLHSRENILYLQKGGIDVFDLVNYDHALYPLFDGWREENGDGVIQLDSTSAGATSAPVHSQLPASYMQQNTYCTCGGNHISPDRAVDASTGVLCETTFYFDEGDHERTGGNDVMIELAVQLMTDKNFKDVHTYPDVFPQFNTARDTKWIRGDLARAKALDRSAMSAENARELQAAIDACDAMLANTIVNLDEMQRAKQLLDDILIKLGEKDAPKEMTARQIRLTDTLHNLSDWAYRVIGPRGFSDVLRFKK